MSDAQTEERTQAEGHRERDGDIPASANGDREMSCPMCGASMPDLKGGKASICPNCGFKDSCCY